MQALARWGFTVLLIGILSSVASAQTLSEEGLFRRCYAQLTQRRIAGNDPLLLQIRSGTRTAISACQTVLDAARFTAAGGTEIADRNDSVAKAVLSTFHQLHRSWARDYGLYGFPDQPENLLGAETWYDDSPIGAYITRALFGPGQQVGSVLTGNQFLQPRRLNMTPSRIYRGVPNSTAGNEREFRLGSQHPFAGRGELVGIEPVSIPAVTVTRFGSDSGIPDFNTLTSTANQAINEINFPDITALRGPLAESNQFAALFQGQLSVLTAGSYSFTLDIFGSNDQAELWIDGVRVISARSGDATGTTGSRTLGVGNRSLQVRYRQFSGSGRAVLSWQPPGQSRVVIPASSYSNLQAAWYLNGPPRTVEITGHLGGGFIGNHNYFLTTFREASPNFSPDGLLLTNRSWARAVLKDTLCREVPVVRESDVASFVIPSSTIAFRQNAACTSCHASLDRQAGLIRGMRYAAYSSFEQESPAPDMYGILGIRMVPPTAALRTDWPDQPDASYGVRAPHGRLYFRNYRGELIDIEVQSIEGLAQAIRNQDDFYACFAKRYYQYFLGVNVDLSDPGNPTYRVPNEVDAYHRQRVISLGLALRNHGSLRQLIIDILSSQEYRRKDYGIHASANPS